MELEQLKIEETELRNKLNENIKNQNVLKRDELLKKYFDKDGISIGDDVIYQGEKAKVDSADSNYLYIKKYKKDGSLYVSTTRIWSFDKLLKIK